ncbi:MAG: metal dependent phosphohydrolase [Bacteroidetes bacterium]|nr:MAG: metal dependent phosphohydrolase [Bacteroidota bacterium]
MGKPLHNKRKIVNDPVYGFVTISSEVLFDLIEHPWFQRLRRIRQLGMTGFVYPGALHTRFHHALGAMHLMQEAIETLRMKGFGISEKEAEATLIAILLHDIGHGPYSHALEHSIVGGMSHEELSVLMMQRLNEQFGGKLELAIRIFTNNYHKHFLHQLVSSQLDMDRLDYLKRDSFYTGVSEGVINTDRIIKMLTVCNDEIMVEDKGIYSIEKFIVARRLMYWQVYYHKTVVSAENMMINLLRRAKYLAEKGTVLFATPAFLHFLQHRFTREDFENDLSLLGKFAQLDDYDVFTSIKIWVDHSDKVLSILSSSLVNRHLFKIELRDKPFDESEPDRIRESIRETWPELDDDQASYLICMGSITNNAYIPEYDKINILQRDGTVCDIAESSDQLNVSVLTSTVTKYFMCYPKNLNPA